MGIFHLTSCSMWPHCLNNMWSSNTCLLHTWPRIDNTFSQASCASPLFVVSFQNTERCIYLCLFEETTKAYLSHWEASQAESYNHSVWQISKWLYEYSKVKSYCFCFNHIVYNLIPMPWIILMLNVRKFPFHQSPKE